MIRTKIDTLERRLRAKRPRNARPFKVVTHFEGEGLDFVSDVHDGVGDPVILHIFVMPRPVTEKPIDDMTDDEVEAEVRELERRSAKKVRA